MSSAYIYNVNNFGVIINKGLEKIQSYFFYVIFSNNFVNILYNHGYIEYNVMNSIQIIEQLVYFY
jgi:hypothetical protein